MHTTIHKVALAAALGAALVTLLSTSAHALIPPTETEIAAYKADGSFEARQEAARLSGNHIPSPAFMRSVSNKMLELEAAVASGETSLRGAARPYSWYTGLPSKGSPKILIVCIEFSDSIHTNDTAEIDSKIFGLGSAADSPYESLRSYYLRSSYGQLNVQGNVLGWYRTSYPRANVDTTVAARESLIKEALNYYDTMGHDFAQYDNNGDGKIDFMGVLWTGPDNGWGEFWWAKKTSWTDANYRLDGKGLDDYSWQWEARPWPGDYQVKTLIHEFGHGLGLPDYYDYDAIAPRGGVGGLDMMDANHGDHNSFSKFMLEWLTPRIVWCDTEIIALASLDSGQNAVLAMPGAASGNNFGEFFMIDNREQAGNDIPNPGKGLVIWHVDSRLDTTGSNFLYNNSYTSHKLLRLMEADGLEEIENPASADAGDFYSAGKTFSASSTPNSNRYDGAASGVTIDSISAAGSVMTFRVWVEAGDTAPRSWFINDTSTVGDQFTSVVGDDLNSGLSSDSPKRTLGAVFSQLHRGDSIFIDCGTWFESIAITADSVTIRGVDSSATLFLIGDSTAEAQVAAIAAENRVGLSISRIGISGAYDGIRWKNVDTGSMAEVRILSCGRYGAYLLGSSDYNTISSCEFSRDSLAGLYVAYSNYNSISNSASSRSKYGFHLYGAYDNSITGCATNANTQNGYRLEYSNHNVLYNDTGGAETYLVYMGNSAGNVVDSCGGNAGSYGYYIWNSESITVRRSSATGPGSLGAGLDLYYTKYSLCESVSVTKFFSGVIVDNSYRNTLRSITSYGNGGNGYWIQSNADTNVFRSCVAVSNNQNGFYVKKAHDNVFIAATSAKNSRDGVSLDTTAGNVFEQCGFANNTWYAVRMNAWCGNDTFSRCNLSTSLTYPDSYLLCLITDTAVDFRRNWLGVTDSVILRGRMKGPGVDKMTYIPYRLSAVDTTPGADSTAPAAPDTVAAEGVDSSKIRVTWAPASSNEFPGGTVGLSFYRIFRSPTADTSLWVQVAVGAADSVSWLDTGLPAACTRYYRITAVDNAAPIENSSFYSDSIACGASKDTNFANQYAPIAIVAIQNAAHLLVNETTALTGATSYDTDANPLTYTWSATPSSGVAFSASSESTTTFSSSDSGAYSIVLRISDGLHLTISETLTVRVVRLKGDLTGANGVPDGILNSADADAMRLHYGRRAGQSSFDSSYDVNSDGRINHDDLWILGKNYGQ